MVQDSSGTPGTTRRSFCDQCHQCFVYKESRCGFSTAAVRPPHCDESLAGRMTTRRTCSEARLAAAREQRLPPRIVPAPAGATVARHSHSLRGNLRGAFAPEPLCSKRIRSGQSGSKRHLKLVPLKCYLASNLKRARLWLYAGNHVEPEEEIRNCAFFHARDSDLPQKPVLNLARFRMDAR